MYVTLSLKEGTSQKKIITVLSAFRQICQKSLKDSCMNKYSVFDDAFSKYECGFRKNHSAHHYLIALFETWKSNANQRKVFGALLTDYSKGFGCLPFDFFIQAYWKSKTRVTSCEFRIQI